MPPNTSRSRYLTVRFAPDEIERLERTSKADGVDKSVWVRQATLRALKEWEKKADVAAE